jgi:hypothetical protein
MHDEKPATLDYESPAHGPNLTQTAYQVLRPVVVIVGALGVVMIVVSEMIPPEFGSSDGPPPAALPLWQEIPRFLFLVALFAMLLIPSRWALRPLLYWPRLLAHVCVGLYFVFLGVWGIWGGVTQDKDPMILPISIVGLLIGVAIPASVLLKSWIWHTRGKSRL